MDMHQCVLSDWVGVTKAEQLCISPSTNQSELRRLVANGKVRDSIIKSPSQWVHYLVFHWSLGCCIDNIPSPRSVPSKTRRPISWYLWLHISLSLPVLLDQTGKRHRGFYWLFKRISINDKEARFTFQGSCQMSQREKTYPFMQDRYYWVTVGKVVTGGWRTKCYAFVWF